MGSCTLPAAPPDRTPAWGCCDHAEDLTSWSPALPGRKAHFDTMVKVWAPQGCSSVRRLLRRAAFDVSRVPAASPAQAEQLMQRMWRPKGKRYDSPALWLQVRRGVGYVAAAKRVWRSASDPTISADHRLFPVLRALRAALRVGGASMPDVDAIIDLDDKSHERLLPVLGFAALHPHATFNSSVLLVPDWTNAPPPDAATTAAGATRSSDPWSGNLTETLRRGTADLASFDSWVRRDARVVWRGSVPSSSASPSASSSPPPSSSASSSASSASAAVRSAEAARGLAKAHYRWGRRVAFVELGQREPSHFDVQPTSGASYLPREAQCGYRHILSVNGDCCHVSHGRLKWALACGALGIWAQPLWVLHWHHLLQGAGQGAGGASAAAASDVADNYVAVSSAGGLAHAAAFYRARPRCAHAAAARGAALVRRYLSEQATSCYWATLLRGLATRLPVAAGSSPAEGAKTIDEWLRTTPYQD